MRLGVISDVHLTPEGVQPLRWHNPYPLETAPERLTRALAHLAEAGVEAIAVLGDLTHVGDDTNVQAVFAALAGAGVPVFIVPGNHDLVETGSSLAGGRDGLTIAPWRAVELGGARLFGTVLGKEDGYRAVELDGWPERGDGPAIVLSHFPIISMREPLAAAELADAGDLRNVDELQRRVLALGEPVLALHGHLHIRASTTIGPLLQLSCASLVEAPYEVAVVEIVFGAERSTVRRVATSVWPVTEERIPVLSPADEAWEYTDRAWRPAL